MSTKIYKLEVLVLGLNGLLEQEIHLYIEHGNRDIFAEIKNKEVVEVDWDDSNLTLNNPSMTEEAYRDLFPSKEALYVKKIAELEAKLKAIENRVRDFALDIAYPDALINADCQEPWPFKRGDTVVYEGGDDGRIGVVHRCFWQSGYIVAKLYDDRLFRTDLLRLIADEDRS